MFIKKNTRRHGDQTYETCLLVESVNTPNRPRHETICNLGHLAPGPKEEWLGLAERMQATLSGQPSLFPDPRVEAAVAKARAQQAGNQADTVPANPQKCVPEVVSVRVEGVRTQDSRAAGPLHVGHQMWQRLQIQGILKDVGLPDAAVALTELMTLNRLVHPDSERAMVDWARRAAVSDVLGVEAEKDRAIREKQEERLLAELDALARSVQKAAGAGRPLKDETLGERIGRLRERYARAARYYDVSRENGVLAWSRKAEQHQRARQLDGAYFLRTSDKTLGAEEIWRTYINLTRIESAFRDLKGTLDLRPIHHRKEMRIETHIFLCVLAYHLQVAIERSLHLAGDSTSWEKLREELGTHQVVTVVLPTPEGRTLAIRKAGIPTPTVREIYRRLNLPAEPMKPIRTWI